MRSVPPVGQAFSPLDDTVGKVGVPGEASVMPYFYGSIIDGGPVAVHRRIG